MFPYQAGKNFYYMREQEQSPHGNGIEVEWVGKIIDGITLKLGELRKQTKNDQREHR